jgi:hypothetical protein
VGLISRWLGGGGDAKSGPPSSQFADSGSDVSGDQPKSRNAPRRDLVRLVLREAMRRHGVPSDWLECRMLSVLTRQGRAGMHVQFLVRQGDHQLLGWVHAFQESFWEQILRMDPRARDWLFSVGWEFYGKSEQGMPDPESWKRGGPDTNPMELDTIPPEVDDEEALASDLEALQAAMSRPAELVDLPEPGKKSR